ncbi:MAG: penicillin-binding protein 2 [bacterium]
MPFYMNELERQEHRARINKWSLVILGAFLLLLSRFLLLQFIQHDLWGFIAENNQLRKTRMPAVRGKVYDRNHKVLADWRKSFNVTLTPADINEESLQRLSDILEVPVEDIREELKKNRSWSPFIPVPVVEDISWAKLVRVEEDRLVMPGVGIEVQPVRKYNRNSVLASHLLGHMGEIDKETLRNPAFQDYRMGDYIGQSGLEKSLENKLRGRDGISYRLVDALGREISVGPVQGSMEGMFKDYKEKMEELHQMSRPQNPGTSAVLTLDMRFQKIARRHMGAHAGSVVAMDVKTGEILALLSTPGYDPSTFVGERDAGQWEKLRDNPYNPLFHRAIQGAYPPASVFKLVMAAGALEEDIITPSTVYECKGKYKFADSTFRCWKNTGHGKLKLKQGIAQSCDVYFYKLGEELGIDSISKWARKFGMGSTVGIGLPEEKSGLVPDRQWKRQRFGEIWYPGETISVAIGQGYLHVTPLQAVLIGEAIANDGTIMQPQLIHHLEDFQKNRLTGFRPKIMRKNLLDESTARVLQESMEQVVEDEHGTARRYVKSDFIRIAGKTGTAEVSKKYQGEDIEDIPYKYRDHSWFLAYAPADDPEVVMVVLVEHGGPGSSVAGPVARQILEDYFSLQVRFSRDQREG